MTARLRLICNTMASTEPRDTPAAVLCSSVMAPEPDPPLEHRSPVTRIHQKLASADLSLCRGHLYHCAVDRVDLWLNARQGWSREVLAWVTLGPFAVLVGLGAWEVAGMAWWIPVPVSLIVLGRLARPALQRRGGRRPVASRGTSWSPPDFSWRRMGTMLLFTGALSLLMIMGGLDGSPVWHHWHRTADVLIEIGSLGYAILGVAEYRYMRRLRRIATQQPSV